jgi:DegV family protein with EDD domain
MRIAITSDSAIDISKELCEKYDIKLVPFTIVMGEKEYKDLDLTADQVFSYYEKTKKLAHTAAVNRAQYDEFFPEILKNYDGIVHFTISESMSASYANAVAAAKGHDNIRVIDSKSLSTGIALQAIYARRLAEAGYGLDEIEAKVLERRSAAQASFALENVEYLYRGGRCSGIAYLGANLFHIRPQIIVADGAMKPGKKFRGPMKKWVSDYVEYTLKEFANPDHEVAFVTYSSAPADVVEMVKERLRAEGFKNVYNTNANMTVCCHCGPNTLGILYYNDGDHPIAPKK